MSVDDTINAIMACETIEDLASHLNLQRASKVRHELLASFDSLIEYADANEWAAVVRICEALAIIGWGSREQVDAISRFNGDVWETQLVTDKDEFRFRFGYWSKRKAGWTLRNPQFYASPDYPDRPPIDWKQNAHTKFPFVDRADLPSQRNYRLQMPIIMGMFVGENATSRAAISLVRELRQHLLSKLTPAAYGNDVEKFFFTFHCPTLMGSRNTHLKVGAYNTKQRAFYVELFLDEQFGQLARADQRASIGDFLLKAIDSLTEKVTKRKIAYHISAFRADVKAAIQSWNQAEHKTEDTLA